MKLGRYHACDGCGFTWHGEAWPACCPSCKRDPWWIASFQFPEQAEAHRPLGTAAAPEVRQETVRP